MTHPLVVLLSAVLALGVVVPSHAAAAPRSGEESIFDPKTPNNPDDIIYGGRGVSERSAVAGVASVLVPGLGQAVNKNATPKVLTHAIIGVIPYVLWWMPKPLPWIGFPLWGLFHVWSGWDALIDRRGGYIEGCVMEDGAWLDASTGEPVPAG